MSDAGPDPDDSPLMRPSWSTRRRIILVTLLFCAGEVVYLTAWGRDTSLHETIANGAFILAGAVIGAYVFGAVWDDANVMSNLGRPRRPKRMDFEGIDAPQPPKDYGS